MATSSIGVGFWSRAGFGKPRDPVGSVAATSGCEPCTAVVVASLVYAARTAARWSGGRLDEGYGPLRRVEVTSLTNPPSFEAETPRPCRDRRSRCTGRPVRGPRRPPEGDPERSGGPSFALVGRLPCKAVGPWRAGSTLTGADRPVADGGAEHASVDVAPVVIARIVAGGSATRGFGSRCTGPPLRRAATVRCVVLLGGRAPYDFPSRAPLMRDWSAGSRSSKLDDERPCSTGRRPEFGVVRSRRVTPRRRPPACRLAGHGLRCRRRRRRPSARLRPARTSAATSVCPPFYMTAPRRDPIRRRTPQGPHLRPGKRNTSLCQLRGGVHMECRLRPTTYPHPAFQPVCLLRGELTPEWSGPMTELPASHHLRIMSLSAWRSAVDSGSGLGLGRTRARLR